MKGGRTAPRDHPPILALKPKIPRFNEGGADCPPRPLIKAFLAPVRNGFNEGGADCPPRLSGVIVGLFAWVLLQ